MIEISGLTKRTKKKEILRDINIKMDGIYGLIGPNGAGKTTLMKIISGLTSMSSGRISINGEDYTKGKYLKQNKHTAYLPQDFMIYPKVTVNEALDHIALLKGILDKNVREQKVYNSLKEVNLLEHKGKKMSQLSGGLRKRVGIAQLLLDEPSILLFDEPTAGLDIEERIRFRNLLKHLGDNHVIVISSHIIEDIEFLATRIGILKEGKLLFEGTPEKLKQAAEQKIWTAQIPLEELSKFILDQDVISLTEEGKNVNVRVYSSTSINSSSYEIATPRLLDGYLSVIREHKI
ncbi:ATP-binding cassette domain-containing protein [Pontibacillus litoralis]|uniref:ABC transporter ATP-binding protein n=1 Tax=Pontibacillus litoralis JSM 072002 TaxID=1385512 RepID=A0A0A5G4R7_9BACI|nr:ATP-binding cassette domain-containing protein [Pontibacillus litoralis]KGX86070.1 ABC transporter ATP-binding protein [Pontibacillus litoralis JSM 072002]